MLVCLSYPFCRLQQEVERLRELLERLLTVKDQETNDENCFVPQMGCSPMPTCDNDEIVVEHQKQCLIEEAQRLSTLQALAMDPRNHKHLVSCYVQFLEKSKLTFKTASKFGEAMVKKVCPLLNFDIKTARTLSDLLKGKLAEQSRPRWSAALVSALYGWGCRNNLYTDDPISLFEDDSYNTADSPFDLQPPLPASALSRWYARVAPTVRITSLNGCKTYTLASGIAPELQVNKEFHIVMPSSFTSETPTLNLHMSAAYQTGSIAWKLDSAEFTVDLVTAVELKNTFVGSHIFGQVGYRGRYTNSINACHPELPQCRIGVLINVPSGFGESLKYRRLIREAAEQHVHVLFWQPKSKSDVDGYISIIKGWQTSCRQQVPFAQHKTCVPS